MAVGGLCNICPRQCGVDRTAGAGYCGAPSGLRVSAVCLHRGEEPAIGGVHGIVNVFFAHCNLQCIYCQNASISTREVEDGLVHYHTVEEVADRICELLPDSEGMLGLVTPSHYADQVPAIVEAVHRRGMEPTVVYNCGGYERVSTLRSLEGLVDVYLPDFKYSSASLARAYSGAADYPQVARAALTEMVRQVGAGLKTDERGVAYRGLVVRHLVLPGAVDNSLQCLRWLADEFGTERLHLSLMAQYFPPREGLPTPLDRCVEADEYAQVVAEAERLGFAHGWQQELEAERCYRPDFHKADNPFEP